jgi:hypothetical protein
MANADPADDRTLRMRAPAHYLRVCLDDPAEAEYWLVVMDCDRARLEAALAAVGRDALDVQRWLRAGARARSD